MSELPRYLADAAALSAWLPLIALGIPLLIASLLAVPRLRPFAATTAAWAAAPALLIAVGAPDTGLALPALLLGSRLEFDAIGRPFLLGVAVLWLAAGLLGRAELGRTGRALLYLLAMSGSFAMALAGDLSLFLLASTVTGYSLYGLLGGRGGAQVLVRLLVLSDLILFEFLLLLVHAGAGLQFAALPQSIAAAKDNGLLLMLLLLGFGAKAGLLGVHYWLAPSMRSARPELRPALIAFVLTAGLLPWIRLLAPGAIVWPEAGPPLQWLALATSGFALVAGLLQRIRGALASYNVMALTALWLGLLATATTRSTIAAPGGDALASVVVQSALTLSALMLIGTPTAPGHWRRLRAATTAAGALLLADAVLSALALFAADSPPAPPTVPVLALICAAAGLLAGRMLHLTLLPPPEAPEPDAVPAALLLILGSALMAASHAGGLDAPGLENTAFLLGGAAGVLFEPLGRRLPSNPTSDLSQAIAALLRMTTKGVERLLTARLGQWRDQVQSRIASAWPSAAWRQGIAAGEATLRAWRTAILLVLATAAIAAALVLKG